MQWEDLEQYGVALIFPLSGSIPGLKNRAALLSGALLQASSDVCQRLHSLAEVCSWVGLNRGWGDMCLLSGSHSDPPCTSNKATVRNWTMWKAPTSFGSVSGHFSHHHSFPSLETDWSISFFCLFHRGTNGSFPSVPAALKGFLASPEYIMQCCRASPFFFLTPCLYHVL